MFPEGFYYTREHEWIRKENGVYRVGITSHAVEQLGDITYVELPKVGRKVSQGEPVAVVESVKAASDVFAPVGGTVCEVNQVLDSHPEIINQDPYGEGWFFKLEEVKGEDWSRLLDAAQYAAYVESIER